MEAHILPSNSPSFEMASSSAVSENVPITMPLPPEATYNTREDLYRSIQAWAQMHHYAFRIQRSNKTHKSGRIRIQYSCDRAGNNPTEKNQESCDQARKRKRKSQKTGCQFSVTASEHADGQWILRHRPDPKHSIHNHPPSDSVMSHSCHRKVNSEVRDRLKTLYDAGVKPAQAISYLHQLTSIPLLPHDIYNMNARFRREDAHGSSLDLALTQHPGNGNIH